MSDRSRAWCFTANPGAYGSHPEDPQGSELSLLDEARSAEESVCSLLEKLAPSAEYVIGQLERASTLHLQGFVYFKNARSLSAVRLLIPGAHWEKTRDIQASIKYCSKEDTRVAGPWEHGVRPQQGRRSDIEAFTTAVAAGEVRTMRDAALVAPSMVLRYPTGARVLLDALNNVPARDKMPIVVYLWGPTGSGKTRRCHDFAREIQSDLYVVESNDRSYRFTGYSGQPVVLFDEVNFSHMPVTEWCQLLDRYPYTVRRFGMPNIQFNSRYVFMTSNDPPSEFVSKFPQIARRIYHYRIDYHDDFSLLECVQLLEVCSDVVPGL